MKSVHKFVLKHLDEQVIEVPAGYVFIHCAMQDGRICLWAIVSTVEDAKRVKIKIVGTGQALTGAGKHLGTVMDDYLVWHVFEDVT